MMRTMRRSRFTAPLTTLGLTFALTISFAGCKSESKPVHDDRCGCTFTPAPMMRADPEVREDGLLGYGNGFAELYARMDIVPRREGEALSLASWLYLQTVAEISESPETIVSPKPRYFEVPGEGGKRPAAMLETTFHVNGVQVRMRRVMVDTGRDLLLLQLWTLANRWERHADAIETMTRSLRLDDVERSTFGKPAALDSAPLFEAREAFSTKIAVTEEADPELSPEEQAAVSAALDEQLQPPEGSGYELIRYAAAPGPMRAYLTQDPGDGKKHPAVLWVEGGFGGPSEALWTEAPADNDPSALAFSKAGIVVMSPAFRGELGNPGQVEQWYGETEDVLAALEHLRAVPWVDPERVYLAGHSTGGTQVLLAAVAGAEFRAAFVFGARADLEPVVREGGYGFEVFDIQDPREAYFRSPIHWVRFLERPVFAFEGDREYVADLLDMAEQAQAANRPMWTYLVPLGDHNSILAPVEGLVVQRILGDTSPHPVFTFAEPELFDAMLAAQPDLLDDVDTLLTGE